MRFVLLKGQSQYGSLRLHIDQLAAALAGLGHDAQVIDLIAPDGLAALGQTTETPPDAYIGFSGVGSDFKADGASVYDRIGATYVSLNVDHPVHHAARLAEPIRRYIAFFLDQSHVKLMAAWPPGQKLAQVGFLPPGANELPEPVDASDEAFAARDIPLLFTGTYRGAPPEAWTAWEPSPARDIAGEIAQRMAADGALAILDALRASLKDRGVTLTGDLVANFMPLLQAPQAFAEAYHRDALLNALGAAGVPMQIYGAGWEPMVARYPSFTYGGVGSFDETLHLLRRARLVLNTNNGFVSGGHERVFTAMCAGAGVFSDASTYYAQAFKEGREIVTFAWKRMAEAPDKLAALMADVPRQAALARAGHKVATSEHRWADRAQKLVRAVSQVR